MRNFRCSGIVGPRVRGKARRVTGLALAMALVGVIAGLVMPPSTARADYATAGSGRYLDQIQWFSWGSAGQQIPDTGLTETNSFDIGGVTLDVTCTLGNISRRSGPVVSPLLQAYRPGSWGGDGLDDLYNIDGTGTANKLVVGISNRGDGSVIDARFACSASLGGEPFDLSGLVMADAEQSGSGEYVSADIDDSATWRIIDRYRSATCSQSSNAVRTAANALTLTLGAGANCGSGPMAVAFMDGATSANVSIYGGGKSAIALGVMLSFDRSDSPARYGEAVHGLQPAWTGGTVPVGTTQVNEASFPLASQTQPTLRLGDAVSSDAAEINSPAAGADQNDDGIDPPRIEVVPGQPYSLPAVSCTGSGVVAGWIDFNGSGSYDAGEKSDVVPCTGGAATLTWSSVPADTVPALASDHTFMRLRIGPTAASINGPTGFASSGEVEDYQVNLAAPTLTLIKSLPDRADPADQFRITISDTERNTIGLAETSGSDARASTGAETVTSGTYILSEQKIAGPTGVVDYERSIECVDDSTGASYPVTTELPGPRYRISGLTADNQIECTLTNRLLDAGIALAKEAGAPTGNRPGATVPYIFTVTNTGDQDLADVTIDDPLITDVDCPASTLAADAEMTCSGSYTLTQADIDDGTVNNRATVTGTTPGDRTVTDDATATVAINQTPVLVLEKTATVVPADHADGVGVGDRIRYSFEVTNDGNVTIDNVTINDNRVPGNITCAETTLAPDESTTCEADGPYVVTQADIDRGGSIVNTATAEGEDPSDDPVTSAQATASVPVVQADPELVLLKSATRDGISPDAVIEVGQEIHFTFAVRNTGNVTIDELAIEDPAMTGGVTCDDTSLAPGEVTTCTANETHTVTQADVNTGSVTNTANATGLDPDDDPVDSNESSTVTPADPNPSLRLEKFAGPARDDNDNELIDTGDTIAYSFRVQNTGNVTLTEITVHDQMVGDVDCDPTVLDPGQFATCTADGRYSITQDDVDNGEVRNVATATGADPEDETVESDEASTNTPVDQRSGLQLVKHAGDPVDRNDNRLVDAGDTIAYTFTVTNTGTVTIDTLVINDELAGSVTCDASSLPAGGETQCAADDPYVITQANADAGAVDNIATAAGEDPAGDAVTSNEAGTHTETDRVSTLLLDKKVDSIGDVNDNGLTDAGDTIGYAFTVTNTGTTTITDLAIDDPRIDPVSCDVTTLTPGQVQTCHATYTITQADVDAGPIDNTASATGIDPSDATVTSPEDKTRTPTDRVSRLSLDKQAGDPSDVNDNDLTDAGDTIGYTFVITNTGTTTVNEIAVNDELVGPISCDVTSLAPEESASCTTDDPYTITQADVDSGAVDNTATATGQDPDDDTVTSPEDDTRTATDFEPALRLEKTAGAVGDLNENGAVDAGDTIGYAFTVTNTGTVTVDQLAINDAQVGPISCDVSELAPGATATCATDDPYVITQDDVDAGGVQNIATATGQDPNGDPVESPEDGTDTPTDPTATLTLDKEAGDPADANDNGRLDAGDTIDYTFVVSNTGAVTVHDLTVADVLISDIDCPDRELAPGDEVTCTGSYQISQADIDAGAVDNVAAATGTTPGGDPIRSPEDGTHTPTPGISELAFEKAAIGPLDSDSDGTITAGDQIRYQFLITNQGTQTVTAVAVDDPMLDSITCQTTTLSPGSSTRCEATYTLTQADLDQGRVTNTAAAHGQDPQGNQVTSPEDGTTTPLAGAPLLELVKHAGDPIDADDSGSIDAGDTIAYTFTVTNDGTTTARHLEITDPLVGSISCPTASIAPGEEVVCTADEPYRLTQADLDAGGVHNQATAEAEDPHGDPLISNLGETSTELAGTPGLAMIKTATLVEDADESGSATVGDQLGYRFMITNTGTVTARDLTVTDPLLARAAVGLTCPADELSPGATITCTADPYTITEADAADGSFTNIAIAEAVTPDGAPINSAEATATVQVESSAPDQPGPPPTEPDDPSLPETGADFGFELPAVGLAALLLGAGLLIRQRRDR